VFGILSSCLAGNHQVIMMKDMMLLCGLCAFAVNGFIDFSL
jgi:hypothetical protein